MLLKSVCSSIGITSARGWKIVAICTAVCGTTIVWSATPASAQQLPLKKLSSVAVDHSRMQGLRIRSLEVVAAPAPLANTFLLHSRPTATKVIYLDCDGHTTKDTAWNSNGNSIVNAPFSLDSNPAFSNADLMAIQEMWQRIAECYSPWDVDVTTEEPPVENLINSGGSDTHWGIRVLIGDATPSPAPGAGGVAFVGSFSWASDTPCFVFNQGTFATAVAAVHEIGHTVGLIHDGRKSPKEEYYGGQGFGATGWAPHMGVGYYQPLVQWSKGEYLSANNQEDDLAIIGTQNGFGLRPDDYGNTIATSAKMGGAAGIGINSTIFKVSQAGLIEQRTDTDWFKITCGTGIISLNARGPSVNTMLDIQMDLLSISGTVLATSNPLEELTASINQSVGAGTYYVKIDGVGKGDPLGTGYTDYSSLGQYVISGTYPARVAVSPSNVIATYAPATKTLTLTGDADANSLTVSFKAGTLTVEGANGTRINGATAFTTSHSGRLVLNADLGAGDDSMSIIGVSASTSNIKLGAGNDKLVLTLSDFQSLTIDGGPGIDTYTTTSSTVGSLTTYNLP